jgi:hypothetical protein
MHAATLVKLIKDNLAGQELRISSEAIDLVVDCCGGVLTHARLPGLRQSVSQALCHHNECGSHVEAYTWLPGIDKRIYCRIREDALHTSERSLHGGKEKHYRPRPRS